MQLLREHECGKQHLTVAAPSTALMAPYTQHLLPVHAAALTTNTQHDVECCVGVRVWSVGSRGLCGVGQEELVLLLEALPGETHPPSDIFAYYYSVYQQANKGVPLRLLLRLCAEFRYYPCPLVSTRNMKPVFSEIGHTIMDLLVEENATTKNFMQTRSWSEM